MFFLRKIQNGVRGTFENPSAILVSDHHERRNVMFIRITLFIDPQTQPPAAFCPVCGGECYAPSLICLRCEGGLL